jgi:hypothetical protein
MTPRNGNRINGNKEVTGNGTASVIHQTAISVATAAVTWARGSMPASHSDGSKKTTNANRTPMTQPNRATINELFDFSVVIVAVARLEVP